MPDDLKLSVSKCKTFVDCAKKFKYVYVEKLPRKDWSFHTVGKFVHKALEDFHRAYVNGSTEPYSKVMSQAYKAACAEFKDKMTKEMIKECFDMINQYLKLVSEDKKNNCSANVIDVEKNFSFHISENIILNGMIDRIQVDDDGILHIADYKTTKNKKYLKDDFFQLLTYAYVMLQEDPSITQIRGSYILIRHKFEYITKDFGVEEILSIKDNYIKYANAILSEKEYKANPSPLCAYCDHVEICEEGKKKTNPQSKNFYGEVSW